MEVSPSDSRLPTYHLHHPICAPLTWQVSSSDLHLRTTTHHPLCPADVAGELMEQPAQHQPRRDDDSDDDSAEDIGFLSGEGSLSDDWTSSEAEEEVPIHGSDSASTLHCICTLFSL